MGNRVIRSHAKGSSLQIADCIASLFTLELLAPGPTVYLISPWISDIPILSNVAGQWRAVLPDEPVGTATLSMVLRALAEKRVQVRILCRPDQSYTEDFLRKLVPDIEYRYAHVLHEKGLIGTHFYLRGSMNFTYSGLALNEEYVELSTDPSDIALAHTAAAARWMALDP